MSTLNIALRHPSLDDGMAVFDLVNDCKPLDLNSRYLYLLQCSHFANQCVLGTANGNLAAWVSTYVLPEKQDTLFIWQVAVSKEFRYLGLGKRLIQWIVAQQVGIRKIQSSITLNNTASWGLFNSLAQDWDSSLSSQVWLKQNDHFDGHHHTEILVEIELEKKE
jgi:L-2,4-diaminobutyric acid acetyltransferase